RGAQALRPSRDRNPRRPRCRTIRAPIRRRRPAAPSAAASARPGPAALIACPRAVKLGRMQRIACDERPDWKAKADAAGFRFHTIAGERYWDERAYYAFTLKEIEEDIEAPTAELDAMCRELVARAVDDERMLRV